MHARWRGSGAYVAVLGPGRLVGNEEHKTVNVVDWLSLRLCTNTMATVAPCMRLWLELADLSAKRETERTFVLPYYTGLWPIPTACKHISESDRARSTLHMRRTSELSECCFDSLSFWRVSVDKDNK